MVEFEKPKRRILRFIDKVKKHLEEIDDMVKSKTKKEKKEETTAEFVARMNRNQAQIKRNGLKRNVKGARR